MKVLAVQVLLVLWCVMAGQVAASDTDLSERKVEIRYNFEGSSLILFGSVRESDLLVPTDTYDVITIVQGPNREATVRRKAKVGGIWMNNASLTFQDVPGYYALSSTKSLADFIPAEMMKAKNIGFENLPFTSVATKMTASEVDGFRQGLYRQRSGTALYQQAIGAVEIVGQSLFRADINLPSHTPVGMFRVDVHIVQNGQIVASSELELEVDKAGFEKGIYDFAHEMPFLYGLTAVFIALGAGWLAGVLGKK